MNYFSQYQIQATSHLVVKNLDGEEREDLEVSLGFSSPHLHMDYLARALYKVGPCFK